MMTQRMICWLPGPFGDSFVFYRTNGYRCFHWEEMTTPSQMRLLKLMAHMGYRTPPDGNVRIYTVPGNRSCGSLAVHRARIADSVA